MDAQVPAQPQADLRRRRGPEILRKPGHLLSEHHQTKGRGKTLIFFLIILYYYHYYNKVNASSIEDCSLSWVSKCGSLEYVELVDNRDVTPAGFAQLIRSCTSLKSIGRCPCLGQVLSVLYDEHSVYRRQKLMLYNI